ncbi:MAG TPA: hypothetical protein VF376_14305 [Thermoanaerobaculia bacterium]
MDAAFDRIGSALGELGYAMRKGSPEGPEDRVAVFASPKMAVRVSWQEKARLMILQVRVGSDWVEFTRRSFGPKGLEESTVDGLVRAVHDEVAETSTDGG